MSHRTPKRLDMLLLVNVLLLLGIGFFTFTSASLGLLAREGPNFSSIAGSQLLFGIGGGLAALFLTSQIYYRFWRRYAFYIFLFTLGLTALVFVPGLGLHHAGAVRWIDLGVFTLQPSELLKIGFVIYVATWLSGMWRHTSSFMRGTLPFLGFVGVVGMLLLLQPDTDTFLIIAAAGAAMFFVSGSRFRDIALMALLGVLLLAILAVARPYVMDRLLVLFDPAVDPQGSSYQIQQSLIAIGSGGMFGRGYGQSIQKFEYLPEPIGDSIFAVYAEEFGFLGTSILVILFTTFAFRGYRIASHAPDRFGMLLVVGLMTLIVTQAFLNIYAMVGFAPMLGLPLPFVSHGGTALLTMLASVGIILNVSRYATHHRAAVLSSKRTRRAQS